MRSLPVLCALAIASLAVACASSPPARNAAPELEAQTTLDGEPLHIAALDGHVVVLDFMSAWCEPCIEALPAQRAMHQRYRDEGLVVLMISQDEERADMDAVVARHNIPFPVVMDGEGLWFDAFSLRFVPSLVVLDKRGQIAGIFGGYDPADHPRVLQLVETLLDEPR